MIPVSPFKLKKTRQTGRLDDNKIVFDDLKLVRKNGIMLFLASLSVGLYARNILKMSPLWYISAFIPLTLLKIHDFKQTPYSELENFYRYALDVKSARERYENQRENIIKELKTIDEKKFGEIQSTLKKSETTLMEVVNELDRQYLEL